MVDLPQSSQVTLRGSCAAFSLLGGYKAALEQFDVPQEAPPKTLNAMPAVRGVAAALDAASTTTELADAIAWVLVHYLYAALQRAVAHLRNQLQGSAELLPGPAQCDHGAVGVGITQALQTMALRQRAHPVKQLPCPAQPRACAFSMLGVMALVTWPGMQRPHKLHMSADRLSSQQPLGEGTQ